MRSLFVSADAVSPESVNWFWPGRIPRGAITNIEGDPATNKSTLIYHLAACISRGDTMPDSNDPSPPGSTLLIGDEDTAATIRRALEANSADLKKIFIYDKLKHQEHPLRLPADIGLLETEIARVKAHLVVLDPISSFVEGSINVEHTVRNALGPLTTVAERTGAAIVLVRHLRKATGGSALYRGSGSIALTGVARSNLLVGQDPGNSQQRVVVQIKSSLGSLAPSLLFRPVQRNKGLAVEWLGRCGYSADAIFASATSDASALHEAAYALYSVLGAGPLWADEAKRLVLRAGIAERTLRRAKQLLMVKSKRDGFGKNSQFYWILPERNDLMRHLHERDLDELADALFHNAPKRPPDNPIDETLRFFEKLENDEGPDQPDRWNRGEPDEDEGDDGNNLV